MRKIFRYFAMILGFMLGLFLLVMSFDSIPSQLSMMDISAFLIHLLPGLLIIISSLIAFRYPGPGFIIFIALALSYLIYFHTYRNIESFIVITLPMLIIITLLFITRQKKIR